MYAKYFKRIFDLGISIVGLVVSSPLFFLVTVILWLADGGIPFFVQVRVGRDLKLFKVIKFKTMRDVHHDGGSPDEDRVTAVGRVIRSTSLDEIPQLLNVIRGDMSLVGPRPLLVEYIPLYSARQLRRHNVRPGITGWAQVNGRNLISWKEKFEYDVWYVDHVNFWLDLKILLLTLVKVVKAEGISEEGALTARKFDGSN